MPKVIKDWNDLVGLESETHKLKIDTEMGCGWILPKVKTDNSPDAPIGVDSDFNRSYLSTHTFYGKTYKGYEALLNQFGFDVELCSWDEN